MREVRMLVVGSCTGRKSVACDRMLTMDDFRDPGRLPARLHWGRARRRQPGPARTFSSRSVIESNAVALLSNKYKPPIDPPSPNRLGQHAPRAEIRESGLWNVNHIDHPTTRPS